jgi:hypothetical protein
MVDPISAMNTVNKYGKYFLIAVLLLNFTGVAFATEETTTAGATGLQTALKNLCETSRSLLAVGAMLMIILAAAVYAVGQILGAETRARASVWATAMLTGAVIGIIIYIVVPWIIGMISGTTVDPNAPCDITFNGATAET